MNEGDLIWLAADYHFPTTFSCRIPTSSMSSASAMPAPGPAAVRLALIRTGIEIFGVAHTEHSLFPVIRSMEVRIKPPAQVALTYQIQRAYKANSGNGLEESVIYRESTHAREVMTVYVKISKITEMEFSILLQGIGYWGQTNSLTNCTKITQTEPRLGDYGVPLAQVNQTNRMRQLFPCLTTEFRDTEVEWSEIMPGLRMSKTDAIRIAVFVWPLTICERHRGGIRLQRRSID